jgi:hypothetical protein
MGLIAIHRLHAAPHHNDNDDPTFDGLLWNPRSNRSHSYGFGNCSSRPRNFTSSAENIKQMARQTCKGSLPGMVVCIPLRRNSLHPNVRRLSFFLSLCGCGGFKIFTRLLEGKVAFCVCVAFLRLLGCGIHDFLHTLNIAQC